ncbi:efflux RND transporter permease subunit [Patescibacteria group bacterium]|nr:efflux RND transporter permease subunit [Patescibacteria group bacterium]
MENNESFITRWSKFFIHRYRISILIILAILIAGFWGVTNNQRQDFPSIRLNFLIITAVYPGASPADIEQEVVIPIEQAATAYDEVDYAQSRSQNSFGMVEVFIKDINDIDSVAAKLNDDLSKIGLPNDVEAEVQTIDSTGPSIAFGMVGNNGETTNDLLQYASDIKSRLETSSNEVKYIEIAPANEFKVQITLDLEKMNQNRISYDLVKNSILSQIVSLPGGSVETDEGRKESITVNAPVKRIEDLQNISLGQVKLADVSTIERLPKDDQTVHYVGYKKDGLAFAKESVYLMAYKNDDGDIITMSEELHAEIDAIKADGLIPDDVDIVTGYNLAPFIDDQIDTLLANAWYGLILILIVLLFFINFRTAIVVALVIPIVFLIGLFALAVFNFTLNILTLFAMILTLGILVDNAIVIAEGIVHELDKGASRVKASITSVKKYGSAVTAATITTVVVFIPFAMIGGIMGEFLKYIPYTIIIIILASYFAAISITPLLGRWFLKEQTYEQRRAQKIKGWQKALILPAIVYYGQNFIDWLSLKYKVMMQKIYKKLSLKLLVIAITTILMGVSFGYFFPQLEFEQMPSKDGDTIQVDVAFPSGTPFEEQKEVFIKVQNEIIKLPYFQTFYTFGNTVWATFDQPVDRPDGIKIFEIVDQYDTNLNSVRDEISKDIVITPQASTYGPPLDQFQIVVNFLGNNNDTLFTAADDLESWLAEKDGIKKVLHGPREALIPAIDINLNQKKLADNGISAMIAGGTVNAFFSPQNIGSVVVRDDGISDDVLVNFSDDSTNSIDDLRNLIVPSLTGASFAKLSDVADINSVENPVSIRRLENNRVATISVELEEGVESATLDQEIKDYLTEDKLKSLGLEKDGVTYGGEYSTFESDYSKLQIVFVLAMLAVYLILVYQFYSYMQPALIMFAVPLALIGVFPGLILVNSSLNMISGLGIIALVGIVVNDAIVFIDTYNRYKDEYPQDTLFERLARAGHTRFKPIFSTSITTIGGILPLTLMDPFWTGLGTSIISGLIFSTIGTLIAVPVLYGVGLRIWYKLKRQSINTSE